MDIFRYFKKLGINTIEPAFYSTIDTWKQWYAGDVIKFHRYKIYNGKTHINCRRLSLQMAKKLAEDTADLLLNEKVKFTVDDERTNDYIHAVLENNRFQTLGNHYQEWKAALGTVAYVCQIANAQAAEDGSVRGGDVKISYLSAEHIFPISWENGRVVECAFTFRKTWRNKAYMHLQLHTLQDVNGEKQYVIENHVVNDNLSGTEITPDKWDEIEPFKGMQEKIFTGMDKPQFVIDKLNLVNLSDDDDSNPMGVPIYESSLDVLRSIDTKYDSYNNEFHLGKKRLFVDPDLAADADGNPVFDPDDTVYYQLPEDTLAANDKIHEYNPQIRVDEHSKALNDDLNLLSFKCGFGTERYKFDKGTIQTATQVVSENSDLYRTLCKHELVLESVLKELMDIIIRLGIITGEPGLNPDAEKVIDFDDSIIEDKQAERQTDRTDVSIGAMSIVEYRAKWYGETEEEAAKHVIQNEGVIE